MAFTSAFFDAELVGGEYDRVYSAEKFAEYFASFIANGVFPDPSTNLQVVANTVNDMNILVSPGIGWINGYYCKNDDSYPLAIQAASGTLNRIDAVIIGWSRIDREITLYVKTGTASSSPVAPSLTRNADLYELMLATITVNAGVTKVTQSMIVDKRADSSVCGWVAGVVQQIDTTNLFAQYDDAFKTWFNNLKAQLSDNVVANLQSQIDQKLDKSGGTIEGTLVVTQTINHAPGIVSNDSATVGQMNEGLSGRVLQLGVIAVSTNDEIDSKINALYNTMPNNTTAFAELRVDVGGLALGGGTWMLQLNRADAVYGFVFVSKYGFTTEFGYYRSWYNSAWGPWQTVMMGPENYIPTGGSRTLNGNLVLNGVTPLIIRHIDGNNGSGSYDNLYLNYNSGGKVLINGATADRQAVVMGDLQNTTEFDNIVVETITYSTQWVAPYAADQKFRVLMVGGGGGGGGGGGLSSGLSAGSGGGGGSGEFIVSTIQIPVDTRIQAIIGSGGAGGSGGAVDSNGGKGSDGGNTIFHTLTALGGHAGNGGGGGNSGYGGQGGSGGCGGGGGGCGWGTPGKGGNGSFGGGGGGGKNRNGDIASGGTGGLFGGAGNGGLKLNDFPAYLDLLADSSHLLKAVTSSGNQGGGNGFFCHGGKEQGDSTNGYTGGGGGGYCSDGGEKGGAGGLFDVGGNGGGGGRGGISGNGGSNGLNGKNGAIIIIYSKRKRE